jgi:bleomycin hydrolase
MKNAPILFVLICNASLLLAQPTRSDLKDLESVKRIEHTSVKDQASTSTCWSFATISLIESQTIHAGLGVFDLSEMFIVRNVYAEKARNYILRQGAAKFGPGGLGHDVINGMTKYGAVPESVYSGLSLGKRTHNHDRLDAILKSYLDSLLTLRPIPPGWMNRFQLILDDHLGKVPQTFTYREKVYTPLTFAADVLKFKRDDYVFVTSFSHHPFYSSFVLEVPDNHSGESYFNLPLNEMITLVEQSVQNGYSVMWDTDVSNDNFNERSGFALHWKDGRNVSKPVDPDLEEGPYNQQIRQALFESLVTADDHLMHIVGLEKSHQGKKFFLVKNSYGDVGPFKGYIKVSEPYFAINTISIIVPRAALDNTLKAKLGIK